MVIDPCTALAEFADLANGFLAGDGTHWAQMLESTRHLRRAIELERNLLLWYPSARKGLSQECGYAAANLPAKWSPQKKEAEVRRRVRRLLRAGIAPLRSDLEDPVNGYRPRLLQEIEGRVGSPPTTIGDWQRFDVDLTYLASLALADGHEPGNLIGESLSSFERAGGAADAAQGLRAAFLAARRQFCAAVVFAGVSSIANHYSGAFSCSSLGTPVGWPSGTPSSNRKLRDFRLRQVREQRTRSRKSCCVLLVPGISARAGAEAKQKALVVAERLQDQLIAEHRLSDIRLIDIVATHDEASDLVEVHRPSRRSAAKGRTLLHSPNPNLEGSLRFYAEGRQERVPTLAVLHYWIALEYLAADAQIQKTGGGWISQPPTTYLPPHVAAIVGLAAVQAQLTTLWQLLSELGRRRGPQNAHWLELERWLGVRATQRHVDLVLWTDLLREGAAGAAPSSLVPGDDRVLAAAFLRRRAAGLGAFAEVRLAETRWRLSEATELRNWALEISDHAAMTLVRTKLMRHRAVHRARLTDDAAPQVAQAAKDIVDAVYQVLPRWLSGSQSWHGFRDARAHFDALTTSWSSGGAPRFDARRLINP